MALMTATFEQKRRVKEYFDKDEGWQGDIYRNQDRFARAITRRKDYAFRMLDKYTTLAKGTALDAGFGSGVYVQHLMERGFDTYGIDISPTMLHECRARVNLSEEAFQMRFRTADVEQIPFGSEKFDLVLCIGVLGYLLGDDKALREIFRVLKPGGYMLVSVQNMMSLSDIDYVMRARLKGLFRPGLKKSLFMNSETSMISPWVLQNSPTGHRYRMFNPRKLEVVLSRFGFELVAGMTFGFECRLLRKLPFVPSRFPDALEVLLEKWIHKFRIPYLSYSGEAYTALVRKGLQ